MADTSHLNVKSKFDPKDMVRGEDETVLPYSV